MPRNSKEITKLRNKRAIYLPDNLIESYDVTTLYRKIGIYGERFIDAVTQAVNQYSTGAPLSCGILAISENQEDHSLTIKLDIRRVMSNSLDQNYRYAEETLMALQRVLCINRKGGVWSSAALITEPSLDENPESESKHVLSFRISEKIVELFESRGRGYRQFNPLFAFKFSESTYKIYKLLAQQEGPISYNYQELLGILGYDHASDTYTTTSIKGNGCGSDADKDNDSKQKKSIKYADFTRRVLDRAKEEMDNDNECATTFDYVGEASAAQKREKKKGRPSVDIITFFPKTKKRPDEKKDYNTAFGRQNEDVLMPKAYFRVLEEHFMLDRQTVINLKLVQVYLLMHQHGEEMWDFITDNQERLYAREGDDRKRYLVGMLYKHCKDKYGVDFHVSTPKETPTSLSDLKK